MDGSGVHCKGDAGYDVMIVNEPVAVARIPTEEHTAARAAIAQFMRENRRLIRRLRIRLSALVSGAKGRISRYGNCS